MSAYTEVDHVTSDQEAENRSPLCLYDEDTGERQPRDYFERAGHRDGTLILHLRRGLFVVYARKLHRLPFAPSVGDVVTTRRDFRTERTAEHTSYVWQVDDTGTGTWQRVPGTALHRWVAAISHRARVGAEPGEEAAPPELDPAELRVLLELGRMVNNHVASYAEAEGLLGDRVRKLADEMDDVVLRLSPGTAVRRSP